MRALRLIAGIDPRFGGPPVSSINSAIAAARAGVETTFAFGADDDRSEFVDRALAMLEHEGVRPMRFVLRERNPERARRWGISPEMARWYRGAKRRFDVVHCHGAWVMPTFRAMIRRRRRTAYVLTPHESLTDFDIAQTTNPRRRWLKRKLRPVLLRRFDLVLPASQIEADDSIPRALASRVACRIIHHAVYDDRAAPAHPRVHPVNQDGLHIGYLGRLHAKKNVDALLRTLPRLGQRARLLVGGDGPERQRLRDMSVGLGVFDRVEWLGFVEGGAKRDFFRRIHVLAMPSDYECFGMAAAEALAEGIPVVVSPWTGISEIVSAYGGGEIVPPEPEVLAKVFHKLLHNVDALAQYSRHAAAAAENTLSFSVHGAAIRDAYELALAAKGWQPDSGKRST